MRKPSSVTSVSPVSGKLGLSPVSHTLNTGDLVLRDPQQYLMQQCIERLWVSWCHFLCVGPSVQNCHRHVKILDMSDERTDQSMRTILFLLVLVRCILAVILGLVLSLVFAQKSRTTDLNTSSMYTGLIKCPSIST